MLTRQKGKVAEKVKTKSVINTAYLNKEPEYHLRFERSKESILLAYLLQLWTWFLEAAIFPSLAILSIFFALFVVVSLL